MCKQVYGLLLLLVGGALVRILSEFNGLKNDNFLQSRCINSIMSILVLAVLVTSPAKAAPFQTLFGYTEIQQSDIHVFPQWLTVLENQHVNIVKQGDCINGQVSSDCQLQNWHKFLTSIRDLAPNAQLDAVNRFANEQDYVVDIENYGHEDYWALPGQFLTNGGDCEDYAIVKLFSLLQLGWPAESMRLVVVQDTNLGMPHAILAVASGQDVWILDNQAASIVAEQNIEHYAPVYSISGRQWWLHMPPGEAMATASLSRARSPALP